MHKRVPILIGFCLLIFSIWFQTTTLVAFRSTLNRFNNMAYDLQLRAKIFGWVSITEIFQAAQSVEK